MNEKNTNFLFFGTLFIFVLLIIILGMIKEQGNKAKNVNISDNKDLAITVNYAEKASGIFSNAQNLDKDKKNSDEALKLKNQLLDIKITKEYKDFHIKLVLALAKIQNFYLYENEDDWLSSQKDLAELKKDYPYIVDKK